MRFGVLGPLEVVDDGGDPVDVGGRQPRVVLAALAAAGGRAVTAEALVDAIWGDAPPTSAIGTLQTYVSRLRRTLSSNGRATVALDDAGYRLVLGDEDELDLVLFERSAASAEALLAEGHVEEAQAAFAAALALWRGPALADLVNSGTNVAHATALEERRLTVLEQRLDADLALGRHAAVVGELQALAGEHPLREGLHAKRALALYRSGRQADALRALADAAALLRDELGLEPSRQLRDLEAAILAHDRALDLSSQTSRSDAAGVGTGFDVGAASPSVPFVGRDLELVELLTALKEAENDARFVVLEGEPGIGKTRLADELASAATAAGSRVVWGRSNELGGTPSLWPWLPVLRDLLAEVDVAPTVLGDVLLGESPLLAGQGGAVQFERFDAIAALLEHAGADVPLVVLQDDLQWADAASLELVQFLSTRLRRGVLLVATVRAPVVGDDSPVIDALGAVARRHGSRRLRLRGLSPAATGELLGAVAPTVTDTHVVARIHQRADGNPFYAIELARLLQQGDTSDAVPSTVRDVVRRRLRALPPDTVAVLECAAVMGREVEVPLLLRALGCEANTCLDWLEPATVQRLLVASTATPGALRFDHALVREVLLEDLTPVRRARLHLQAADAIASTAGSDEDVDRDQAEMLAEHLWQAQSLGVGARAAAGLERAAQVAISRVAYASAETLLGRAALLRRAAGSTGEAKRAELAALLRLLEVMQATRFYSGTDRDALKRAHDLATDLGLEDVVRKLEWTEWAALSTSGQLAEALPKAQAYAERWRDDARPEVASVALAMWGVDECSRGRIESAVRWLDRAGELLDGLPPPADDFEGQHRLVAQSFGLFVHAAHGDLSVDDAMAGYEFLAAVVPPVAVPAVCAFGGTTMSVHARWELLERLVDRALESDPGAQLAWFGGQLLMFRALVLAADGALDEALTTFSEGRTRFRSVGGRVGTASFQALLGELLARAGRLNEATELISGARRLNDETGEGWNDVTIMIAEGVLAHAGGDTDRASERLHAAIAVGTDQGARALADRAQHIADELSVGR